MNITGFITGTTLVVGLMVIGAQAEEPTARPPQRLTIIEDNVLEPRTDGVVALELTEALGTADFTIGLSVETPVRSTQDWGDIASLWNPSTRHGWTLSLANNSCTTSQANWRQLQFGIDAGTEPKWRDEGRPGSAILGFSLAVHDGQLYVGTCESGDEQIGHVYRYAGPGKWDSVGTPDGSNAVTALATFDGQLYAGTGKYRLGGSSLSESTNPVLGGKVYRFVRPGQWELVGDLSPTEAIAALIVYDGKLYASSLYPPAGFFRYEGGTQWTSLPTPGGKRVNALGVHGGSLYATSYDGGNVYRFDGTTWHNLGPVDSDITQTYSFATWQDDLHVSTWPTGKVYRLDAEDRWLDRGQLGSELEVMGMLVHNGSFYAGTLPNAEIYRYEGDARWQFLKQLDETPNVKYRRLWTMATYQGRLFTTTLPSGKIWSMSAGVLVTDDRELAPGWHDVIAERRDGKLRLFVDGQLVAEADAEELFLATEGLELKIGDGPRGRFSGRLKNVWFERL